MIIEEALNQIIDDGIEACKLDYKDRPMELKGSVAGFEACRNKTPIELKEILDTANQKTHQAFLEQVDNYWEVRCFALEVEWVCNVLSAILMNNGLPIIIPPTCRGILKAADIVGVKELK